jgi:hypothetical protein
VQMHRKALCIHERLPTADLQQQEKLQTPCTSARMQYSPYCGYHAGFYLVKLLCWRLSAVMRPEVSPAPAMLWS